MAHVGLITGSGSTRMSRAALAPRTVATPFGPVIVTHGRVHGHAVTHLARHGAAHERLSHQVEHRPTSGRCTSCGCRGDRRLDGGRAVDGRHAAGVPILFADLYFPSNRLPDGALATIFTAPGDPRRGHWIPGAPFSPALRAMLESAARSAGIAVVAGGCYAHADGPRFNTPAEHAALRQAGATAVSQTCGPEAVLAGELEIPYALVGFGVNLRVRSWPAGERRRPPGGAARPARGRGRPAVRRAPGGAGARRRLSARHRRRLPHRRRWLRVGVGLVPARVEDSAGVVRVVPAPPGRERLEAVGDERRPAGLVRGAEPAPGVAVEVLVEEDQVAPVRIGREARRRRRGTGAGPRRPAGRG